MNAGHLKKKLEISESNFFLKERTAPGLDFKEISIEIGGFWSFPTIIKNNGFLKTFARKSMQEFFPTDLIHGIAA